MKTMNMTLTHFTLKLVGVSSNPSYHGNLSFEYKIRSLGKFKDYESIDISSII